MTTDDAELARKAHRTLEPLHVLGYFAPEPTGQVKELGVPGGMRAYVGARSAPVGPVPAEVVTAMFFNFAPARIASAVPSVWEYASPADVLAAWRTGVDLAYRRVLGEAVLDSTEMAEAADLAEEATTALDAVGRPLYAAHTTLAWPEQAHMRLFHAQTLLREHRGDAHVAALMLAGLDGAEALVLYVPVGQGMPESLLRATRGWTDEDWDAAVTRVTERGLLDTDGSLTAAGQAQRELMERQTDQASVAAYRLLGPDRTNRLRELARPWSRAISESIAAAFA